MSTAPFLSLEALMRRLRGFSLPFLQEKELWTHFKRSVSFLYQGTQIWGQYSRCSSHKSGVEREHPLPWPSGHTSCVVAQKMIHQDWLPGTPELPSLQRRLDRICLRTVEWGEGLWAKSGTALGNWAQGRRRHGKDDGTAERDTKISLDTCFTVRQQKEKETFISEFKFLVFFLYNLDLQRIQEAENLLGPDELENLLQLVCYSLGFDKLHNRKIITTQSFIAFRATVWKWQQE